MAHEVSKKTGYGLEDMAKLYGERGCCSKGTCIHLKAKFAVTRIKNLEKTLKRIAFGSVAVNNTFKGLTRDEMMNMAQDALKEKGIIDD